MERSEFISKYSISDTPVADPSSNLMHARAFAEAIREFINEGFRASAEVSVSVQSDKSVLICPEYAALFLRMLFNSIFGRVYLNIDISERDGKIIISVSSDTELPLSRRDMNSLTKAARNAGFTVEGIDGEITASLAFSDSEEYSVYAGDFFTGKRRMHAKLCEIFFAQNG